MSDPGPRTVVAPEAMEPLFVAAERVVAEFFAQKVEEPEHGTIEIGSERYVLVRAASLSVEFFRLVRDLVGAGREAEADAFARNVLFDLAHGIGRSDAHTFAARTGATDPMVRLSAGPVLFAHAGWAKVELSPESSPTPDENFHTLFDHPYSFEADAWLRAGVAADFPVCIMSAGYSSGWCAASYSMDLVATELTCRARGEAHCRFVMAPPHRIEERATGYFTRSAPSATRSYEVPGLFSRKRLEERLQRAHAELEDRVRERTAELERANARLRHEMGERERVERQLRQSQKMEAIGRLAGGIAHDFNNVLAVILGQSTVLARRVDASEVTVRAGLADITAAAEQARALTQQLLALSRTQIQRAEAVDLDAIVDGMSALLSRLVGDDVQLAREHGPGVPAVWAEPSAIQQIVLNLVVNARDRMPRGGAVTLSTARVVVEPGHALAAGEYAELVVTDAGVGMDDATRERIFDPFFTTKTASGGTGLGLSTVYGIVTQCGGEIAVESAPGEGARFRVLLPAYDGDRAPARAAPTKSTPPIPRRGRVLVVDDDPTLRRVVRGMLASLGFEAEAAASAEEALALIDESGAPPLVVSDVMMPGMNGAARASRQRAAHPTIAVVRMSGVADVDELRRGIDDERVGFLSKPFSVRELADVIERLRVCADTEPRLE